MIILYILLGLLAAVLILAALRPNTFTVQRQAVINAPAERIFPLINDFHHWEAWSPWDKMDPTMKRTYSGAQSGPGAKYAWLGNKKVGEGSMEILSSQAPSKVTIKLDFLKPFEAHNTTVFSLSPAQNGTTVVWMMTGPANFMTKLFGLLFNMEKMVGKDFERGLANLKEACGK
jgi:hypothetical protein